MGDSKEVCKNFLKGVCRREGNCRYSHPDNVEVKQVCKDFMNDKCNRGERCKFKHPPLCKDLDNGYCPYGDDCRYYHPKMRNGPFNRSFGRDGPPFGRDGPPFGRDGPSFDRDGPSFDRDGRPFGRDRPISGLNNRPFDEEFFNRRDDKGLKRPFERDSGGPPSKKTALGDVPEHICRDYLRNDCFRTKCSYSHNWPPRGGSSSNGFRDGPKGFNDGSPASEMATYIAQLERKLNMYEDRVLELEKRCEQYEEFNKLLSERNDELKLKLEYQSGGIRGPSGSSGGNRLTSSFY